MKAINELLEEIEGLEPMPAVVQKIMEKVKDPQCGMSELADLILFDPMLTATVLKSVNSAFYALQRKIDSVQEAITVLGINQVVDIVILKSGARNFKPEQKGYGLYEGALWKSAVVSAVIARELAQRLNAPNVHLIFTVALIKDIGKMVLDRFVAGAIDKIQALVHEKGYSFREAEKKIIGVDHAEIGAYLANKWGFSPEMASIIRNHHLNNHRQENIETDIIYLTDNILMMMGVGVGEDGLAYRFHEDVLLRLGITPDDLQCIIADCGDALKKIDSLISTI